MSLDYDNLAIQIINNLFRELVAINPAFRQAWPTEREFIQTKRQWMLAFVDAGINSFEQIKSGIQKIRLKGSPFVPTPGEFIKLCQASPKDIGAPTARDAYLEACQKSHPAYGDDKQWSHPAVEIARNKVRPYRLVNLPEKQTYKDFEAAYFEACQLIASGRNAAQIEESKEIFSAVELNWAMLYRRCVLEGIDPATSTYFPSPEIVAKAESLYHAWKKKTTA